MEKFYTYFISYSYSSGSGMIEMRTKNKIESFDDLVAIRDEIKKSNGLDVTIMNFILLS